MIKKLLFKNIFYKFSKLASTINLKPSEFLFERGKKYLCLCPHPDDESIGMGGVLALHPGLFDVILLTDGRKGFKEKSEEETVKLRAQEFECAMNTAKIKNFSMLNAPDKKLLESFDIFKTLDLSAYDYIFIPNIIDQHPDHKAVSLLLERYIHEVGKVKKDAQVCFYEVWSTLGMVNSYVDISDAVNVKKSMIDCYKTQISQKDYEYHALGLNQYRGMLKDKKYVEAFCVLSLEDFTRFCLLY